MCPDTAIGPDEAKYWRLDVQRVQVPDGRSRRHAILSVRIIKHVVNRLLVFPETGDELEASRAGQLHTRGTLARE
jgi:hypothetical protein